MDDFYNQLLKQAEDAVCASHTFLFYQGQLYEQVEYVYVPVEPELIQHYFEAELGRISPEGEKLATIHRCNELVAYIRRTTMLPSQYAQARIHPELIAFSNGFLDTHTGEFKQYSDISNPSEIPIFFNRIPHKLDMQKYTRAQELGIAESTLLELAPQVYSFLEDIVGSEKLIYQLYKIAYCFYRANPYKVMFLEVGEGDAGKSTFLNLIKAVLGASNLTFLSMQQLADANFSRALLYEKLANIFADLPRSVVKSTGMLKLLTGEDTITADRKFLPPITFRSYAKPIFSANALPSVKDLDDTAFFNRIVLTFYQNKFPASDFGERLVANEGELEGLICAALIALRDILDHDVFLPLRKDYSEMWARRSNSIYDFVKSSLEDGTLVLAPDSLIAKSELYLSYTEHAENPATQTKFTQELSKLFSVSSKSQIIIDGKREWAYRGIGRPQPQVAPEPKQDILK